MYLIRAHHCSNSGWQSCHSCMEWISLFVLLVWCVTKNSWLWRLSLLCWCRYVCYQDCCILCYWSTATSLLILLCSIMPRNEMSWASGVIVCTWLLVYHVYLIAGIPDCWCVYVYLITGVFMLVYLIAAVCISDYWRIYTYSEINYFACGPHSSADVFKKDKFVTVYSFQCNAAILSRIHFSSFPNPYPS